MALLVPPRAADVPDMLLPHQNQALRDVPAGPERALVCAVLEQAVHDLRRYRGVRAGKGRQIYESAARWMAAEDLDWPFSFVNACAVAGAHPDAVRRAAGSGASGLCPGARVRY